MSVRERCCLHDAPMLAGKRIPAYSFLIEAECGNDLNLSALLVVFSSFSPLSPLRPTRTTSRA